MKTPNRRPWRFVLLTALILLAGGMAVGMAARLVVFPQADETVEVDTPTIPSVLGQSVDEVVFYPWDRYDRTPSLKVFHRVWKTKTSGFIEIISCGWELHWAFQAWKIR